MFAQQFLTMVTRINTEEIVNESTTRAIGLTLVGICWFIYTPIICYFTWKYYQHRHHIIIQKHYPYITYTIVIFILLHTAIGYPFTILYLTQLCQSCIYLEDGIWPITVHGLKWTIFLKFYIIWYDMNYAYYFHNKNWQYIIDKSSLGSNWFLNNKMTYGNISRFSPIIIIFAIINILISFLVWELSLDSFGSMVSQTTAELVDVFTTTIPIICHIYLYCKTPKFMDNIFFLQSSKYTFIFSVIWGFQWILLYAMFFSMSNHNKSTFYYILFAEHIKQWAEIGITFSCTYLILYNLKKSHLYDLDYDSEYLFSGNKTNKHIRTVSVSSKASKVAMIKPLLSDNYFSETINDSRAALKHLLCGSIQTIHAFVLHLNSEFSLEIFVSFVEFTQYLKFILLIFPEISKTNNWHNYSDIELCDSIPYSTIVENSKISKDFYGIGYKLFQKYIKKGTEFELNISSRLRTQFVIMFDEQCEKDLPQDVVGGISKLFIKAHNEMFRLLSFSFGRFQSNLDEYGDVELGAI